MKFIIGDKVAIYNNGLRVVGKVVYTYEQIVEVKDKAGKVWRGHAKQCRRLLPKYPRMMGLKEIIMADPSKNVKEYDKRLYGYLNAYVPKPVEYTEISESKWNKFVKKYLLGE